MEDESMTQASGSGSRPRPSGTRRDVIAMFREKQQLRQKYRKLIAKTEEARSNLAEQGPLQLSQMLKTGAEYYEQVKGPAEGVLDSRFLLNASEIGNQMARNLRIESGFEIDDYLSKCAFLLGGSLRANGRHSATQAEEDDFIEPEDWDWAGLGRRAAMRTKRAATIDFMLGPLAVEDKKRNVGKRAPVEKTGPVVKPKQLNENDMVKSENETTKLVQEIHDRLFAKGGDVGINFFEFAIDPKSFSNTVENIFYISFLVKEARISIEEVGGEPILMCVDQPEQDDYDKGLIKQQIVMEIDIPTWKDLIEVYNIKTAMIPSRVNPPS